MRSAEGLPSLARDNESSPVQVSPSGSIGIDRTSVGRLTLRPTLKYYRNRVNIFRLEYKEHSLIVRGEQLPLDLAHDPIDEVRFSLETDREGDARDLPIHSLNLEMDREEVVGGKNFSCEYQHSKPLHAPCAELGTEDREDPKRLEEGSFGEAAEEWGFYHKVKMERNYLAFHSKQSPYKNHPGAIERYH
ncbi:Hypothetical predicted protein [Octopus vulgaris]|uniref:Uncharacterized protein n=1 Tax=Octopus vulgaris TaxID=6645 RepID=A0AA36C0D2_OCTVU|nr:Hypothetical predicted protein [Octopus vulgaris]